MVFMVSFSWAQEADYIVIKKKNHQTLKTYFAGAFISAETFNGFRIHGYIQAIRNDSIIVLQEQTQLVNTSFGTDIDTVRYILGLYYNQIRRFNYKEGYRLAGKKGFRTVTLPKLMTIGGTGFVILELVNTLYREESITANNKLTSLAIATGTAVSGWLWSKISRKRDQVGKKYVIQYIRAKT
jgi:hypothetical protein